MNACSTTSSTGSTLVTCWFINNSRVLPARLYGYREGTGGHMEFLLLKQVQKDVWEVMVRPGKKAREGLVFEFGDGRLKAEVSFFHRRWESVGAVPL